MSIYNTYSGKQFASCLDSIAPRFLADSWIMSDIYSDLMDADSDQEVLVIMEKFYSRISDLTYEMRQFKSDVDLELRAWKHLLAKEGE